MTNHMSVTVSPLNSALQEQRICSFQTTSISCVNCVVPVVIVADISSYLINVYVLILGNFG